MSEEKAVDDVSSFGDDHPFGFSDENTLTEENIKEILNPDGDSNVLQQDPDEEEADEAPDEEGQEEVLEEEEEPEEEEEKPSRGSQRIKRLQEERKQLKEQNEQLRRDLEDVRKEIEPLKNLAKGLEYTDDGGNEKELSLDDELARYGDDPASYDSDGEKRLALKLLKQEKAEEQRQSEQIYQRAESHIIDTIQSRGDEKQQQGEIAAVDYLIQERAADIADDYGVSQREAIQYAKRQVMDSAAQQMQKSGKDITDILIERGLKLYGRRNPQAKQSSNKDDLNGSKKPAKIDPKRKKSLTDKAGRSNVDTIDPSELFKEPNDFMSKFFSE